MYLPASSLAQLDFSLPCRFSSGDVQSYQLWIYGEQQDSLLSTKLPIERLKPSKLCQVLLSQQRMVLVLRPPLGLNLVALAQHCKCMLCWLHPNVGLHPATSHICPQESG